MHKLLLVHAHICCPSVHNLYLSELLQFCCKFVYVLGCVDVINNFFELTKIICELIQPKRKRKKLPAFK